MLRIMGKVHEFKRNALRGRVNQAFAIGHSLYGETLNLEALSRGYPDTLDDEVVDKLESDVVPLS